MRLDTWTDLKFLDEGASVAYSAEIPDSDTIRQWCGRVQQASGRYVGHHFMQAHPETAKMIRDSFQREPTIDWKDGAKVIKMALQLTRVFSAEQAKQVMGEINSILNT